MAVTTDAPQDYLRTYADTYLVQEIQLEALTRNLGAFARFLEIAARQNGQVTNAASIARDAGINRRTVQNHFAILSDTLIGYWLPAWKLKSATKQVRQSKFYFFDSGVARALGGRLAYPPTSEEMGPLAETFVLNELRAWLGYSRTDYRLYFWRSYDGGRSGRAVRDGGRFRRYRDQGVIAMGEALQPRPAPGRGRPRKGPDHMLWRVPGRAGRRCGTMFTFCLWSIF